MMHTEILHKCNFNQDSHNCSRPEGHKDLHYCSCTFVYGSRERLYFELVKIFTQSVKKVFGHYAE